jgi:hypothetical protein
VTPRLTSAEVAAATRRHPVTVRRALEDGTLHGTQRVVGGRWAVLPECAEAWASGVPCAHRTNVVPLRSAS